MNIIERIGRTITTRLAPGADALKPNLVERLADAIVSIEYYMETVALGRVDPFYMLGQCQSLSRSARCRSRSEAEFEPEPEVAVEPDSTQVEDRPEELPVMAFGEERSEPELVEIFIEEAKEEIEKIRGNLPRWMDQPEDDNALIGVSVAPSIRSRGRGRVIGAQLLGEFAWSVENLLNRIINRTLEPNPGVLEFVVEAADV